MRSPWSPVQCWEPSLGAGPFCPELDLGFPQLLGVQQGLRKQSHPDNCTSSPRRLGQLPLCSLKAPLTVL